MPGGAIGFYEKKATASRSPALGNEVVGAWVGTLSSFRRGRGARRSITAQPGDGLADILSRWAPSQSSGGRHGQSSRCWLEQLLPNRRQQRSNGETGNSNANQDEAWLGERARLREPHEQALRDGLRICLRGWQRLHSNRGNADADDEQGLFRASHTASIPRVFAPCADSASRRRTQLVLGLFPRGGDTWLRIRQDGTIEARGLLDVSPRDVLPRAGCARRALPAEARAPARERDGGVPGVDAVRGAPTACISSAAGRLRGDPT